MKVKRMGFLESSSKMLTEYSGIASQLVIPLSGYVSSCCVVASYIY